MKKYLVPPFLSSFLWLFCGDHCFAQRANDTSIISEEKGVGAFSLPVPETDTVLKRFSFDSSFDSVRAYKSRQDFKYMRYLDSLLRNTRGLTVDTISLDNSKNVKGRPRLISRGPGSSSAFNAPFIKIFFWILAVLFIGFILYKLFLTESFFKRTPRKVKITEQEPEEKVITSSGYEKLINEAIFNKDFRSAIRYLYLQTLQRLSMSGFIQLSPDKTNYEYVKDLSGKVHQNEFASLTLSYEYVWYGKFDVDREIFNRLQKDFNQYQQKL
jgi:hypothetical protein